MKIYVVILTLLAVLAVAGCSVVEQPANQTTNTANTTTQTNQGTVETKPAQTALSPTETLLALNEASKQKDLTAVKSYLSQGTLDLLKREAEKQKKTVDEVLKEDEDSPFQELPQTRNEVISGDTATVDVKNTVTGEYEPFPLVKENGAWKVALDVYVKNLEAEAEKESKESESKKQKK